MNLYLEQKLFSWKEKFVIKDDNDNDRYTVVGQGGLGTAIVDKQLKVTDANGNDVALITEDNTKFFGPIKFDVIIKEQKVCEVSLKTTWIEHFINKFGTLSITGVPWQLSGAVLGRGSYEYKILDENSQVVMLVGSGAKKDMIGNAYILEIAKDEHELLCLCIMLAVNCVIKERQK